MNKKAPTDYSKSKVHMIEPIRDHDDGDINCFNNNKILNSEI